MKNRTLKEAIDYIVNATPYFIVTWKTPHEGSLRACYNIYDNVGSAVAFIHTLKKMKEVDPRHIDMYESFELDMEDYGL